MLTSWKFRMVLFQGSFRNIIAFASESHSYGWWKKSCTSWYGSSSHYLQGFLHPRWLFGISEPSTVSYHLLQNHIHIFIYVQVSPDAKVSVKLVANAGIGTIAAGVAKVGPLKGLLLGYGFFTDMNEWSKTCILYNEFVDVDIFINIFI